MAEEKKEEKTTEELLKAKEEFERKKASLEASMAFGDYTDAMREAEDKAATKRFDELFADFDRTLKVFVPELGCNIQYRHLRDAELDEVNKVTDDTERGLEILYRMWHAGDQTVTREKFNIMPKTLRNLVATAIYRKTPFLQWTQYADKSEPRPASPKQNSSSGTDPNIR